MFYLIDKPPHITSFDVIRKLRKLTGVKKMGHIGTLDPFATGVMVIATGKSTKLIPLLEGAKKEYIFEVRLDGKTETLDTDTPVVSTPMDTYRNHSREEIESFLLSQKTQIPPKYSALHIDGKRAYDRARIGEEFEIAPRDITVYEAEVQRQDRESLDIRMVISGGGYIRSFAPLLGSFFGVDGGGYLRSLRRISIMSDFARMHVDSCEILGEVLPSSYSYSSIFHTIPTISISAHHIEDIRNGKSLPVSILKEDIVGSSYVFLRNDHGSYVSLCRKKDEILEIYRNDVGDL